MGPGVGLWNKDENDWQTGGVKWQCSANCRLFYLLNGLCLLDLKAYSLFCGNGDWTAHKTPVWSLYVCAIVCSVLDADSTPHTTLTRRLMWAVLKFHTAILITMTADCQRKPISQQAWTPETRQWQQQQHLTSISIISTTPQVMVTSSFRACDVIFVHLRTWQLPCCTQRCCSERRYAK